MQLCKKCELFIKKQGKKPKNNIGTSKSRKKVNTVLLSGGVKLECKLYF